MGMDFAPVFGTRRILILAVAAAATAFSACRPAPSNPPTRLNLLTTAEIEIFPHEFRSGIAILLQKGEVDQAITLLNNVDVDAQVRFAIHHGDKRWLAIQDYGVTVPGVPEESTKQNVWIMPGTSCTTLKVWHDAATDFAERYNKILEQHLVNKTGS
jgi:hypothetical protein